MIDDWDNAFPDGSEVPTNSDNQQDFGDWDNNFPDSSESWDNAFPDDSSEQNSQQSSQDSADFNTGGIPEIQPRTLGYKSVGVVVALALVVLALLILGSSNIKISKKTSTNTNINTTTTQSTDLPQQETPSAEVTTSDNGMIEIPDGTEVDYSGSIISSQGVVSDKRLFLQSNQVIYRLDIDISVGATSTTVYYYCGYNTFNKVNTGDILTVDYQQVSKKCFSVCSINK